MGDAGYEALESVGGEAEVAAALVRLRTVAGGQARLLKGAQVMGEQVGGHAQFSLQFRWREVPQGKQVHYAQTRWIGEGSMPGYPRLKDVNCFNIH
ncbi:hypothetical protein StoSoilB5_42830 [Arthrobacter sp. StoSoilB5]|nr:hypothetical protein StoSoilB5_42830 [Arthrobacter sp. StoSoilB5]